MKLIFILVLELGMSISLMSQNRTDIYNAFISGDMNKWKEKIVEIEKDKPTNFTDKLELVSYYYGYIGYSLGVKNKKEAQVYVDKGEVLLSQLVNNNPQDADVYAFKAAFVGFKIAISSFKAPFIGKQSTTNVEKALSINKNNIQANIEKANILYYSPSMFGGDKQLAMEYYFKAVNLFEKEPDNIQQNWMYLSLLTRIGELQTTQGNLTEAKKTFEKILKVEPRFLYVKNELLPALISKP